MKKITYFTLLLTSILFSQNVVLDPSFGVGGKVINSNITSGQAIQIQSDGKIVSCFLSSFSVSGNMHLVRFNNDGTIDSSFGTSGFVNSTLVNETAGVNVMKIQTDGKIVITGAFLNGSGFFSFATVRYNVNGTIDTSFGSNGFAKTDFHNASFSEAVEIQNDGKILVGGNTYFNSSSDFAIVRYLPNGLLDTTFATNGKFIYNFGFLTNSNQYSSDQIVSIKINSVGKIIIGGNTNVNESLPNYSNFGFVSLYQNGTLDITFGVNGQKVVDFGDNDFLGNMNITNDDKIIGTGSHNYTIAGVNYVNIPIVKLLEDGNFDTTFGTNGIVLTNRDVSNLDDIVSDFVIQSDGKLIAVGASVGINPNNSDALIIRFNNDGTIDTTLNGNGYVLIDFNNSNDLGSSISILNNGKILLAGAIQTASNIYTGTLARFSLDNLTTSQFSTSQFSIAPNPFLDAVIVSFSGNASQVLDIDLYDVNGRKIQNLIAQKQYLSGNNQQKLDLPETLSKGIYFLNITDGYKTESIKIVK